MVDLVVFPIFVTLILRNRMTAKKITILIVLFFLSSGAKSQRSVTHQKLVWYGYFLTLQFNEKWYLQTEIQERHFIDPVAQHQFLVRSHIHRTLGSSGLEVSTGFCAFLQNPNDPNSTSKLTVPELRPHVEVAYKQKFKVLTLDHRYRTEARFYHNTNTTRTELADGYDFGNFRFRYNLQATIPVWKIDDKRAFKLKAGDEIHLTSKSKTNRNIFDQNRIYAGVSVDAKPNLTFDVGYLNWFQKRPADDYFNRNIIRFAAYQKIKI
ncbi:DUF2490 domain-containing protein [Pedobacter sp. P351]|uniref:DUF2490 domain-containing protein n=1 Tax=Pedobacter superstes TaxID=3133441 RepID=UPI0030B18A04